MVRMSIWRFTPALGDCCQTSLALSLLTLAGQAFVFRACGAVVWRFTPDI
jgi:hypothetical protein